MGGSVAKEVGCNNYMGDKTNSVMHSYGAESDYDVFIADAAGLGDEEEAAGEVNGDDNEGDEEHEEKKAPVMFFFRQPSCHLHYGCFVKTM
mmetsp:Transcript_9913/g.21446  ORF Transcript_9913/g.21446 Transcript_9913/m.21446 type:complete len:91 (+) Transcript_9913:258-530(+)